MKTKLSINIILTLLITLFFLYPTPNNKVFANNNEINESQYTIFDENGYKLFEKTDCRVGDFYLSSEYKKYEVISIDESLLIGKARFIESIKKPNISINSNPTPISTSKDKIVCLYMTHNDESYVPTDGVDSIYGAGGIHDVAKRFANSLTHEGITTYIDETLHIPHDTKAYSRSANTCKKMLDKYSPNAIFDIHRDGTSRSQYINKVNGGEECKVRIVVGKANSNMAINEEFAIYIMTVANELYPGLIKDIYYASGHYNQGLYSKSLLFEMGCHMMEKEKVLLSADKLANVVNTALFSTTVDSNTGDLAIFDVPTINAPTIDEVLTEKIEESKYNSGKNIFIQFLICTALITILYVAFLKLLKSKSKYKKKSKTFKK